MIDAVFDTNVFLQAALNDSGPAYACWEFVEAGSVRVWVTGATFRELDDVLNRDELRRRLLSVHSNRADEIIETFRKHTSLVATPRHHFRLERDTDDEMFVNLAIEVGADFLVSRDRDLLDLIDNEVFIANFPNLRVLTPVGFLKLMRNQK